MEEYISVQKLQNSGWALFPLRAITSLSPLKQGGRLVGGLMMHCIMNPTQGAFKYQLNQVSGDKLLQAIDTNQYFRYTDTTDGDLAFRTDHITRITPLGAHWPGQITVITIEKRFDLSSEAAERLMKQLGLSIPTD